MNMSNNSIRQVTQQIAISELRKQKYDAASAPKGSDIIVKGKHREFVVIARSMTYPNFWSLGKPNQIRAYYMFLILPKKNKNEKKGKRISIMTGLKVAETWRKTEMHIKALLKKHPRNHYSYGIPDSVVKQYVAKWCLLPDA